MTALFSLGLALFLLPQDATEANSPPKDEVGMVVKTITFPAWDKLEITADLYLAHREKRTPFIVLFHQANLLAMNINFWQNSVLIVFFVSDIERLIAPGALRERFRWTRRSFAEPKST